jgi:hypothetical protein
MGDEAQKHARLAKHTKYYYRQCVSDKHGGSDTDQGIERHVEWYHCKGV